LSHAIPVCDTRYMEWMESSCSSTHALLFWGQKEDVTVTIEKESVTIPESHMWLALSNTRARRHANNEPWPCVRFRLSFEEQLTQAAQGALLPPVPLSAYTTSLLAQISAHTKSAAADTSEFLQTRLSCSVVAVLTEYFADTEYSLLFKPTREKQKSKQTMRCKDGKAIIYAARYMKQNMSNPDLALDVIAKAIGYNPNYFSGEFRNVLLTSPIKYLNSMRLSRTLDLLIHSELPIKSICEKVGIRSASILSSMVKSTVGMTPSEFRRSLRLNSIGTRDSMLASSSTRGARGYMHNDKSALPL
jgi:AraC-like DNA-binding protein